MSNDIYLKLLERLNENPRQYPPIDEVLAFLKSVYTDEQAEFGSRFPLGAHTAKSLAGQLNREEKELEQQLESMADEGLIFVAVREDGDREYSLTPIIPGLVEFQTMRGNDTAVEAAIKMNEALREYRKPLFEDPEAANKIIGTPGLRTLAVEEELPSGTEIADWEKITRFLESEDSYAVGQCTCRYKSKLEGNPCKLDGAMEACVYFGKVADYMIDRKFARRYTKEELLKLLKDCEDQGLIHNINNIQGDNIVMCNCCGCCCEALRPHLDHPGVITIANSNFVATVEQESCTGCGECADICQVSAMMLEGDKAVVDPSRCMGCGNCVSRCPSGGVSLVRCADTKPPEQNKNMVGLGV